ncbi:MAG: hypothetical protein ACLR23_16220 [Clostridia bacterium]
MARQDASMKPGTGKAGQIILYIVLTVLLLYTLTPLLFLLLNSFKSQAEIVTKSAGASGRVDVPVFNQCLCIHPFSAGHWLYTADHHYFSAAHRPRRIPVWLDYYPAQVRRFNLYLFNVRRRHADSISGSHVPADEYYGCAALEKYSRAHYHVRGVWAVHVHLLVLRIFQSVPRESRKQL